MGLDLVHQVEYYYVMCCEYGDNDNCKCRFWNTQLWIVYMWKKIKSYLIPQSNWTIFVSLEHAKWRVYKFSLSIKRKRAMQKKKHKKMMSDSLLQIFWKNNFRPLFSSNSISLFLIFWVCFEWFKTWWVHQLGLYKTSLYYSKGRDV